MINFDRVKFWSDPTQANDELRQFNKGRMVKFCQPDFYLRHDWGQRIIDSVLKYIEKDWTILEIGCNTGKTLAHLRKQGYEYLTGIDINRKALEIGMDKFKELEDITLLCDPIENIIKMLPDYDFIYAGGVYMHLPYDLDWIFPEIASRANKFIMTAENEKDTDFYRFARNYKDIFDKLGWKQIEEENGINYPPLPESTIKRVFVRKDINEKDVTR